MNLIIIIFIVLFVLSFTDFFPLEQKSHNIIYGVAFFLTYFLFTIKYYYGGDIYHYVPVFDKIESFSVILAGQSKFKDDFEMGYLL
ncbi:MAG: hypothetical protein LBN95_12800, partial [Prevotellaceae bacterium]|nr:hypothetical protein [Prevotellaceae bacterium]